MSRRIELGTGQIICSRFSINEPNLNTNRAVRSWTREHSIIAIVRRLETSAPTRIDLAGGTIDIWPLYLFHPGAQTLNAAISIRARARIEERRDDRIVIRSIDTGATVE